MPHKKANAFVNQVNQAYEYQKTANNPKASARKYTAGGGSKTDRKVNLKKVH